MKIVLIGTIVKDIIKHFNGSQSKSFGGLLYTLNAASAFFNEDDCIIPVSYVGEDIYPEIIDLLKDDKRIVLDGLKRCAQKNNTVEITYTSPDERLERSLFPLPPLSFENIQPFLDADVVVVNMISGWDLYLDIHSLTLGCNPDGTRYYRVVDQLDKWIGNCDILQLNECEFNIINNNKGRGPESFYRDYCFKEGKIVNLTRASQGSVTYFKEGRQVQKTVVYPPPALKVVDPTGCGDAFMAGFLSEYFNKKDIRFAAAHANQVAALMGTFRGLPNPKVLRQMYNKYLEENK
jgi:hypothetical protein